MPVYEYTCHNCNRTFERLIRMVSDAASDSAGKIACPECGSARTVRTFSVFAVGGESKSAPPVPSCQRCGGLPGSCQAR